MVSAPFLSVPLFTDLPIGVIVPIFVVLIFAFSCLYLLWPFHCKYEYVLIFQLMFFKLVLCGMFFCFLLLFLLVLILLYVCIGEMAT